MTTLIKDKTAPSTSNAQKLETDGQSEGRPKTEAKAKSAEPNSQNTGVHPLARTLGKAAGAKPAAVSALALATAACGGGGDSSTASSGGAVSGGSGGSATPAPTVARPQNDTEAARFLLQSGFSASTASIQQVQDQGYEPWLDAQMRTQNSQTARQYFAERGYDQVDSNQYYNLRGPGDYMIWSQLFSGSSPVRKRFALALSEFFVVSFNSVSIAHRSPAIGEYWDLLNRNAFGNYRDLIEEITLNPAMGVFLNTRGNRKADTSKGRVPDENYGREIMQLFSIGLYELNSDGTERLSGGEPIETYDNEDVTGIAKVFTGYDYDFTNIGRTQAFGGTWQVPDPDYARQPMTADNSLWAYPSNQSYHSDEEKSFLGLTIPAGTGAEETLRLALDHLFEHPNVGPFFAKQMIQRLVTSNPSPAYVGRVASAFANNGSGQRGDLGAVFKAIVLDDEATSIANASDPGFGKLREPMLRFVQLGRTFGVRSVSGNFEVRNLSDDGYGLGQSPLRPPSVFNFFRPTYFPVGSQAASNDLVAPEFQLVNETTVAGYVNFMQLAINTSHWQVRDLTLDYSAETAIADDSAALVDRLDLLLTANQLSDDVRSTIVGALDTISIDAASDAEDRLQRVHTAVLLVMASTDYLIQK